MSPNPSIFGKIKKTQRKDARGLRPPKSQSHGLRRENARLARERACVRRLCDGVQRGRPEAPSGPNQVLFGVGIGAKRIPGADGDDAERRRWDMPPALAAAF